MQIVRTLNTDNGSISIYDNSLTLFDDTSIELTTDEIRELAMLLLQSIGE